MRLLYNDNPGASGELLHILHFHCLIGGLSRRILWVWKGAYCFFLSSRWCDSHRYDSSICLAVFFFFFFFVLLYFWVFLFPKFGLNFYILFLYLKFNQQPVKIRRKYKLFVFCCHLSEGVIMPRSTVLTIFAMSSSHPVKITRSSLNE